jgi:hypothetical protein
MQRVEGVALLRVAEWHAQMQRKVLTRVRPCMQETLRSTMEPVALLRGITHEARGVRRAFDDLVAHTRSVISAQFASGVSTDFFLKYLGATAAVVMIIGPFFSGRKDPHTTASRAKMLSDMRYHTRCVLHACGAMRCVGSALRGVTPRACMQRDHQHVCGAWRARNVPAQMGQAPRLCGAHHSDAGGARRRACGQRRAGGA